MRGGEVSSMITGDLQQPRLVVGINEDVVPVQLKAVLVIYHNLGKGLGSNTHIPLTPKLLQNEFPRQFMTCNGGHYTS